MTGARSDQQGGEPARAARRWTFGPAVLDERTLELSVNGRVVELERKPLEVLLHLLQHAGEVVTKDELLAAVWPGRVLSDSALTSCAYKLREALDDEQQAILRTVHGFGYRLVAPVQVETTEAPAARFEFKPGEHLPMRPLWGLVQRLGTGGQGEAWLAKHDKTHEKRVYKFAADTDALITLKREITIYRLLHDSLGGRPDFVHLLDWNLEEPPYFLEYAYVPDGSLSAWAKAQGGVDAIPLPVRLEIAAQVADALGAAHSVGVLHKDLKPSNVLIEPRAGAAPQIRLCDFGSGGVLDPRRLEQMGITRLGFTKTVGVQHASGGTPQYLAPEVVAGQPFTVQADIYSLGVLLYQLVVGNFHKAIAPGWEQDVADELLREDIAHAADGHAERRLADAARLAHRLRTLDERRRKREAERAARRETERARATMIRMRARRAWMLATMGVLVVGLAATTTLFVRAQRAAETTAAVSDFLNNDILSSADPWKHPTRTLTVKQALDQAAGEVANRFAERPAVAARLHATIGDIYLRMQEYPAARDHASRAVALYTELHGADAEPTLAALKSNADALNQLGLAAEACPAFQRILERRQAQFAPGDLPLLRARYDAATCRSWTGRITEFVAELEDIRRESQQAGISDEEFLASLHTTLAQEYGQVGRLADAEQLHREVLAWLAGRFGESHLRTALHRYKLALQLDKTGDYDEAGRQLEQGLKDLENWAGTDAHVIEFLGLLGHVRTVQKRPADAARLLEDAVARARSVYGVDHHFLAQLPAMLADAYLDLGRLDAAERAIREALGVGLKVLGPEHRFSLDVGMRLAGCLRRKGDLAGGWAALRAVSPQGLEKLPERHYLLGVHRREEGLLHLAQGRREPARQALAEALAIYEHAVGAEHPATATVRSEFRRAGGAG